MTSLSRRALGAALVAFVVLTLATPVPAGAATPPSDVAATESQFVAALNQRRAQHGIGPLAVDPVATQLARNWSQIMGNDRHLRHNPELMQQVNHWVTPHWQRIGENVGYGWSVQALDQAFYDSPGHRANLLGDFNRVGVGVVVTDRIWVTFVFVKAPGPTPLVECRSPGYVVDGYGGLHPVGGAPALGSHGYWPGWNIVRDVALSASGRGGQKLDAYGGLHPVGDAAPMPVSAYWPGWDIARAVAVTPDGRGAYVLDAYGGLHAAGTAPARASTGYWPGWAVARDLAIDPRRGTRGYVLDAHGGLHPFGGMPPARLSRYLGADLAASVTMLPDGSGGYVTDRRGGVHPFAAGSAPMPGDVADARPGAGSALGVLLGEVPAVATSVGGVVGAGTSCGRRGPWPDGVARAAASL